jgi:membrane-bound ClpP family serine protease
LVTAESVTATVVAPLKPFGYIEVNGERIAASAVGGVMIDAGKQVRICGRNNQTVLVEAVGDYNASK